MIFQRAAESDLAAIPRLVGAAFPELAPYMIYAQPGVSAFLAGFIENPAFSADRVILVSRDNVGSTLAFAEFRLLGQARALLSHIYVDQTTRSGGLGRRLIAEFLERHPAIEELSLDVFSTNSRARALYYRLGFQDVDQQAWVVRPLAQTSVAGNVVVKDLPFVQATFDRFGFCQMTASYDRRSRPLGRIGETVLRCFSVEDLGDDGLLGALVDGYPTLREVFAILPTEELETVDSRAVCINRSIRMTLAVRQDYSPLANAAPRTP